MIYCVKCLTEIFLNQVELTFIWHIKYTEHVLIMNASKNKTS